MYRFAYPAAKYDEEHLDKNIILNLITKHHAIMSQKQKCMDYYMGMHDILSRKREDGLPNAKVVCNHAKDITDAATGYFMGNPITYSNTDDADIEPLLSAFDDADVDEVDADNAQDMSIYGLAYEYVYAKKDESKPAVKNISPLSTFIVVDDSIEENELFGVYYYPMRNDAKDIVTWVATVSTQNYKYVLSIINDPNTKQVVTETPEPHYFGGIQIIEYLNNKEGIGDFEQQIPLIDAYNALMSDRVTDKDQFIDAILVLYGAIMGDDTEETSGIDMQRASDFIDGYHQAEKDLELTWEDMMIIHKCIKDAMNFHLYKMMEGLDSQKIVYEEVLKRFLKERKEK